ncbi:MAG: hypothetical protein JWN14_862 [Chthonomonadales bacterium]|nr:hypothetical protein [Chthonomonadales bacterium]
MSLQPEDLERVVPERLSKALDIHLQCLLIAACASPEEAIPILTALENRWEALSPEIREGDVRQQARVLGEMLQVMAQGGNTAFQADARRCLMRLRHFIDVPMTKSFRQNNAERTTGVPPLQILSEQSDGSIETEASEKGDPTSHQRIQEQDGGHKHEDEINRLS